VTLFCWFVPRAYEGNDIRYDTITAPGSLYYVRNDITALEFYY
jgi:hypothetical protein